MPEIFLSYARADLARVQLLVRALEARGWRVFWDRTIPPGKTWDDYIGAKLESSDCVIVSWSEASTKSEWVREEAHNGRERGVLVPALFDRVKPPFGFSQIHAADLVGWDGSPGHPGFELLAHTVEGLLANRAGTIDRPAEPAPQPPRETAAPKEEPRLIPAAAIPQPVAPARVEAAPRVVVPVAEPTLVPTAVPRERLDEDGPGASRGGGGFSVSRTQLVTGGALMAAVIAIAALWILTRSDVVRHDDGRIDLLHDDWVDSLSFSPNGASLATGARDGVVRLFNLTDLDAAPVEFEAISVYDLAFNPDGQTIAVAGGGVAIWRLDAPAPAPLELPGAGSIGFDELSISADGSVLAAAGVGLAVWRLTGPAPEALTVREVGTQRDLVALTTDGALLATDSGGAPAAIQLWRVNDMDAGPHVISDQRTFWCLEFSHDNRLLAAGSSNGLYVWDVQNLEAAPRILETGNEIWSVAFSHDNRRLAVGGNFGVVVWRLDGADPEQSRLGDAGGRVDDLEFSPDDQTLAAASSGALVRLWPIR